MLAIAIAPGSRIAAISAAARLPDAGNGGSLENRLAGGLAIRKTAADWKWIEILQYCGDASFSIDRGSKLSGMAARLADLDPKFVQGFMFNGTMLMWQCGRPVEAAGLLERGIAFNPEEKRLQLYLAAFTYSRMNDLAREIAALERLAFAPDAPFMLLRILSNAYAKNGSIRHAAAICRYVLETSRDPEERRWAEAKIARYSKRFDGHE